MDKKKLIFYGVSIIISVVILLYVLNFASGILKTETKNQIDTETNSFINEKDNDSEI